jgi:hypothetical protein
MNNNVVELNKFCFLCKVVENEEMQDIELSRLALLVFIQCHIYEPDFFIGAFCPMHKNAFNTMLYFHDSIDNGKCPICIAIEKGADKKKIIKIVKKDKAHFYNLCEDHASLRPKGV